MSAGTQSFLFNRSSDWQDGGKVEGMVFQNGYMVCQEQQASFLSNVLDTGKRETVWHRFQIDMQIPLDASIEISFIVQDVQQDLMAKETGEIERLFKRYGKIFLNTPDAPLFALEGQYLWLYITIHNFSGVPVIIRSLKIEFPRIAFVEYLPQVYRKGKKDAFLARFLMIFQSIYVDFEEKLEDTPRLFDPFAAPPAFLEWMTTWFSIQDTNHWDTNRLRNLLANVVTLYRTKGTSASIRQMVACYTGHTPILIEQFEIMEKETAEEKKECMIRLYGENRYVFTVLIPEQIVPDSDTYSGLLQLIAGCQPIDAVCNLAVLPEVIYLDCHCYLGINTGLAERTTLPIEGQNLTYHEKWSFL